MMTQQIIETTEARRHNGQCEYGDWLPIGDEAVPAYIRDAISDEVAEAICRDMRHEPHDEPGMSGNTDEAGAVDAGGERWVYRR